MTFSPNQTPDSLLIGLVDAHAAACAAFDNVDDQTPLRSGEAEHRTADSIGAAIAALPARSLAGVGAKVSAFVRDYGTMPDARDIQSLDDRQAALVASILRDLIALT
jgi:hypothetical protein